MHLQAWIGHSRPLWPCSTPIKAAFLAAFLAPYRLLVDPVHQIETLLKGVQPTHLSGNNDVRQERLNATQSKEVDLAYTFVREIGETIIVPLLRSVEAEDRGRRLVGFDRRFKDAIRLKHKIADRLRSVPGRTLSEGLAAIPDAVRFTLQYQECSYVAGVRRDMERLRDRGLILTMLRNTWTDDQYRGINTRWREPTSELLFEVQFHTQDSFAARELTHEAYERIRSNFVDQAEIEKLRAFQRQVNTIMVPIPPGAVDIGE